MRQMERDGVISRGPLPWTCPCADPSSFSLLSAHYRVTLIITGISAVLPKAARRSAPFHSMTFLSEAEARAVSLIELLLEEAEEQGQPVPEPPLEAKAWSEESIRTFFKSGGKVVPPTPALLHSKIPPADAATFSKWFPGLENSKTAFAQPRLRVLCFPNAGSAEDMYTLEGTGEWCRANAAEVLAVQPPGRNMRNKEPCITTCQELASQLLLVVGSRLYDVPYVVVAHSVGTWVAYEFLKLARREGLPMPAKAFLSAFASPNLPEAERPWRRQRALGEQDFKEECLGWDINPIVFCPAMWPTYHSLMRSDFTLFDEYEFTPGVPRFEFPLTTFYGARDRRITEHMVQGWQRFTSGPFKCLRVEGNHLWPLDKEGKRAWLEVVAGELGQLQL